MRKSGRVWARGGLGAAGEKKGVLRLTLVVLPSVPLAVSGLSPVPPPPPPTSFVAEQVSHHPPISVAMAESPHWNLVQEATAKTSMRPSSLKITPLGFVRVLFPALNARYEWHKVTTQVEDIVSGNKWCDHHGKMVVVNVNTGDICKVRQAWRRSVEVGGGQLEAWRGTGGVTGRVAGADGCRQRKGLREAGRAPRPVGAPSPNDLHRHRRLTFCSTASLVRKRSLTSMAASFLRHSQRSPCCRLGASGTTR